MYMTLTQHEVNEAQADRIAEAAQKASDAQYETFVASLTGITLDEVCNAAEAAGVEEALTEIILDNCFAEDGEPTVADIDTITDIAAGIL